MKKILLTFIALLTADASFAQWTTSGSNIYYNLGNVWIGTTAPTSSSTYNLEAYGTGPQLGLSGSVNGAGQTVGLDFNQQTTSTATRQGGAIKSIATGTYTWGTSTTYAADLAFYTGFNNANNERMRILSTGNVGIGTSAPTNNLQVSSAGSSTIGLSGAVGNVRDYYFQTSGVNRWVLRADATAESGSNAGSDFNIIGRDDSGAILGSYFFIKRSNGNIGVGTTNPSGNLEISGFDPLLRITHITGGVSYTSFFQELSDTYGAGLRLYDGTAYSMSFRGGNVGIGTTDNSSWKLATSTYKLAVGGSMIATSVTVKLTANWPDYVFEPNYHLLNLSTLKTYIGINHHLPDMPSENEIAKSGIDLGEMNKLLVKKTEELTLYLIEKDKQLKEQQAQINQMKQQMDAIEKQLKKEIMKKILFIITALLIGNASFGQWTTSGSNIYYNLGNVGIGTASPGSLLSLGGTPTTINHQQLGILYSPTDVTGLDAGLTCEVTPAPTANSSATYYGIYSQSGTNTTVGAYNFTGRLIGVAGGIKLRGTGIANTIYAFYALSPVFSSTGTATISYGMYINPQRVAGGSLAYGIYQFGATDSNYFAGSVSIGTVNPKGYKLAVNGSAIATSMTVKLNANWPDYVFRTNYHLPRLATLKAYINQNHHLPEIPSEEQVAKDGLNLGEMNKLLVKKTEELTLYLIDKDEQLKAEQSKISEQENKLKNQQTQINLMKQQMDAIEKQLKKRKS